MAEIRTIRTARKTHRCQTDTGTRCHTLIQPGDRYLVASLPPDSDLGNTRWWTLKVCQGCAEQHGQTLDEQATPRRSVRRRPRSPLETHPTGPYRDEPRLNRPTVDVHLPA